MLTTDQKGSIAELAVVHHAARLGVGVLWPLTDGHRYDLVFDIDGRLFRVQCKFANRYGDVVVVRCRSARRTRDGFLRRTYSASEIDLLAAYCLAIDRCYLLPPRMFAGRNAIQLRLTRARNNQKRGINWAESFEFEATLRQPQGAVAQLGERLAGSQ
jgi:hypothetical protein